jgi:NTP pyrophosphatase (non-canonical NTP hydrolase)
MEHPVLPAQPTLQDLQQYIAAVLVHRGFDKQTIYDELLMLCEEVGELAKAIRQTHGMPKSKATDSQSFEPASELADVLWMVLALANRLEVDAEQALRAKEEKNKQRVWQ